jgi:hypothetical protein
VVQKLNTSEAYFQYPGKIFLKEDDTPEGTMAAIQHLANQLRPNKISTKLASTFDQKHIFTGQRILFGFSQSQLDGVVSLALNNIRPSIYVLGKTGDFYA